LNSSGKNEYVSRHTSVSEIIEEEIEVRGVNRSIHRAIALRVEEGKEVQIERDYDNVVARA
jgi:hypothetical protein